MCSLILFPSGEGTERILITLTRSISLAKLEEDTFEGCGMKYITIYEAKTKLSKLIRDVLAGKQVIIARGREPVAQIIPYHAPGKIQRTGWMKGIRIADDFDKPLEDFREYTNGDPD